jgi:hypothetical protein
MNCNVQVFCKMIFSNKFGFILETVFSYSNGARERLSTVDLLSKCVHFAQKVPVPDTLVLGGHLY